MHTATHTAQAAPRMHTYRMEEVATRLNTGKYKLLAWLREINVLHRDIHGNTLPTSRYINTGYFHVVNTRHWNDQCGWIYHARTDVTTTGLAWLLKKYEADHAEKNH